MTIDLLYWATLSIVCIGCYVLGQNNSPAKARVEQLEEALEMALDANELLLASTKASSKCPYCVDHDLNHELSDLEKEIEAFIKGIESGKMPTDFSPEMKQWAKEFIAKCLPPEDKE